MIIQIKPLKAHFFSSVLYVLDQFCRACFWSSGLPKVRTKEYYIFTLILLKLTWVIIPVIYAKTLDLLPYCIVYLKCIFRSTWSSVIHALATSTLIYVNLPRGTLAHLDHECVYSVCCKSFNLVIITVYRKVKDLLKRQPNLWSLSQGLKVGIFEKLFRSEFGVHVMKLYWKTI